MIALALLAALQGAPAPRTRYVRARSSRERPCRLGVSVAARHRHGGRALRRARPRARAQGRRDRISGGTGQRRRGRSGRSAPRAGGRGHHGGRAHGHLPSRRLDHRRAEDRARRLVVSNAGVRSPLRRARHRHRGEERAARGLHRSRAEASPRRDDCAAVCSGRGSPADCCCWRCLLWMLRRRLRRRPASAHSGSGALANARRDFARIEELSLIDAGERGRYVALHVDVLREYLAERHPGCGDGRSPPPSCSRRCSADAPVPLPRLVPVLAAADLIKYADRPVTANRARELAAESRGIVNAVEEAVLHRAQTRGEAGAGGIMDLLELPAIDFASPYVLLLLLLIPIWWLWRRGRRAPAIVFSRADVLARGRRGGAFTRRLLGILRILLLVGTHRGARASALRRAHREREQRGDQHRHRDRSLELDALRGLPAAESTRGREGQGQAVHPRAPHRSHRPGGIRGRGADAGAAHRRLSRAARGRGQFAGGAARGWHRHRHGDRHGRESPAQRARTFARSDSADRRREQSRSHRSSHGGSGRSGRWREDLHDRGRDHRDGARSRRARAHGDALRISSRRDR